MLALFLAVVGYQAWSIHDYKKNVREAREAGFSWQHANIFDLIRQDWWAALNPKAWAIDERSLTHRNVLELGRYRDLIHRLRPTRVDIAGCENVDALRGLTSLRTLYLINCPTLQNLDVLQGLTDLQILQISSCPTLQKLVALKELNRLQLLYLSNCPALQDVDVLKDIPALQHLDLSACTALKNVDALKGLPGLESLSLYGSLDIPAIALRELRLALPNTDITFPDGSNTPPQ